MAKKKGRSEKKKDWLGRSYVQHYDADGNKRGRSERKETFWGKKYTQHYDSSGTERGRSERKETWLGRNYTQKYNSQGEKSGTSEQKTTWLGRTYTQHYDAEGTETDRSERKQTWLGKKYIERYGNDAPHKASRSRSSSESSPSGYSSPEATSQPARTSTTRGSQLLIGLLLLVGILGSVLWITSTVDPPVPAIVRLEGKILRPVAPAPPPSWLKKIAGNRTITSDNYPPPANFQITDRCAGEACGFERPWRALKEVSLYEEWGKRKSQSVYTLSPRETVFAESGIWITRRAGVFEVTTPISIGGIELRSGDLVYSLMYLGENFMRGYFHGYLAEFSLDGPNNQHVLHKLSDYDAVLWVQMKTGTGIVGWTNDAAYPSFDGQSPSGGAMPYVLTRESTEHDGLWDYELEVFPAGNKASIVIGDVVIPCPDAGVQRVHTGFVIPGGKVEAVDLVADQPKELLAETFVRPRLALSDIGVQPKPSVGTLSVLAPGGAEVILDDVARGTTDEEGLLLVSDVVVGPHRLLVRKPGYITGEYEVELAEGENKPVSANLRMLDGYLTVRTDQPGTTVQVANLGRFDNVVSDVRCPPGRYTVTASHPMMKTETRSVVIAAGEHTAVEIEMTPDPDALQPRVGEGEQHAKGLESGESIGRANKVQSLSPNNETATGALAERYFRAGKMAAFTSNAIEALRGEGAVRFTLIHDHAGIPRSGHAVVFKLMGKTVSFAPIGQRRTDCALPSDIVPFQSIESIQVTRSREGEVFLVLKMPGFSGSDKTSEFRFVVVGSHLESRTVHTGRMTELAQEVQVSPRNASKKLDAVAQVIRLAKEGVR